MSSSCGKSPAEKRELTAARILSPWGGPHGGEGGWGAPTGQRVGQVRNRLLAGGPNRALFDWLGRGFVLVAPTPTPGAGLGSRSCSEPCDAGPVLGPVHSSIILAPSNNHAAVVPAEEVPARPCPLGPLPHKGSCLLLYSEYIISSPEGSGQQGSVTSQTNWTGRVFKVICV